MAEALNVMDLQAGVFNTPVGAEGPGVVLPGSASMMGAMPPGGTYEFEVKATHETPHLSFATMFVQSNDLFIGPGEMGIALFDMDGLAMMMDAGMDKEMGEKDDMMAGEIMLMDEGSTPHTVVGGDMLGSISRRAYGSSKYSSVICSANELANCNLIHIGDELMLPSHGEAMSIMDDKMADKDSMMADDAMMKAIMLMEDGDTLGSIAKRAYGSAKCWSAICSANELEDCDLIHVNDEMSLPTQADADEMMDSMMMDDVMDAMDKKDDS